MCGTQPGRGPADGSGPGQVCRLLRPQAQGGDPLIEQEAIGQLQGVKRGAVGQQLRWWVVEAAALIGWRDGQHADPLAQGGAGDGQAVLVKQVHMQAAEREAPRAQGGLDQFGRAVAAEAHLAHQPFIFGPGQQVGAGPLKRPLQMLGAVQAMHGQVGELGHAKARQDRAQLPLAGGQVGAGQQFAGDAPAPLWAQVVPLQGR